MKAKLSRARIASFILIILFLLACALILPACNNNDNSSGTNVQVEGIDESDIVKVTDDGYIFKVQYDGVTISKADNGQISLLKAAAFESFSSKEMFLFNDILVIIGSNSDYSYYDNYGYVKQSNTTIKYFRLDMDDESEELDMIRETTFEGSFFTGRIVEGNMYIVTEIYSYTADNSHYTDSINGKKEIDNIEFDSYGFIIAKINLNLDAGDYLTSLYCGNFTDVYCSPYAFYLLETEWTGYGCDGRKSYSRVVRVSFETLKRDGEITDLKGLAPDRFALHDNGNNLFVVNNVTASSSSSSSKEDSVERGVYVYAYDNNLNFVSKTGPYAPGETLYAVRYDADFCYFVTYRRVDPLFKINITNPAKMTLVVELKIDGYSTYLQVFCDGLLIGVGYDTDTRFNNATGLKVSLFNINGNNLEEINSVYITGGSAEATYNPKAILCSPEKNIFAFAAEKYDGYYGNRTQGAYIYRMTDEKLEQRAFLTNFTGSYTMNAEGTAAKKIKRVIWIGEYLYTISDGSISSYNLSDLSYVDTCDTAISKVKIIYMDDENVYHTENISKGDYAVQPEVPEKDGFKFLGWFRKNGTKYNFSDVIDAPLTLYARWEKIVKITVIYLDGETVYHTESVIKGECAIPPEEPEKDGFKFLGWIKENGAEYNFSNIVNETVILYANWEEEEAGE